MSDLGIAIARNATARPVKADVALHLGQAGAVARAARVFSGRTNLMRISFSLIAMMVDFAGILGASLLADFSYNFVVHRTFEVCPANILLGFFAAILFVVSNVARQSYSVSAYFDLSGHAQRTFTQWNVAFLAAATFGFLARVLEDSSRGAFIVLYLTGICALFAGRAALVLLAQRHACNGGVLSSRVVVVGFKRDIEAFMSQRQPSREGMTVVACQPLRDSRAALESDLAAATDVARQLMPDDIFIVVPFARAEVIDKCVTAFMRVPASLHLTLDPASALNRFAGAKMGVSGAFSSLSLRGFSMSTAGAFLKRACDIVLSIIALLVFSPLFLGVAIALKLESKGPVLFFQKRHGFNKVQFRIVKFRTMNTMEDGQDVRQATVADPRITPVGRFLRKWNIDELPQLLNVLRGEMSLVGPRPHALVHDQIFETEISLYARRHNVKPGITGWAQVNGFRGQTDTPEKISERVRCDLYYIDNWSFVFDIWILFLTVFSRRAYSNAS